MRKKLSKGSKKLLFAWAFYDWANSVYSLVIASAIFPLYYQALFDISKVEVVSVFGNEIRSTPLISYVTAAAFLTVAIIAPLLSGIADYMGNKKRFLQFFCYLGALSCLGLYGFNLENIFFGLLCYYLTLIGFWGSIVFYNSYLPDIAYPEQQDRVSAKGYSLGYIGSVLLLLFNLVMVMYPEFFSIDGEYPKMKAMQISFLTVGIWWMAFAQYSFYWLPKGNKNRDKITRRVLFNGFRELQTVQRALSENAVLKRYLYAFFVYSMAVQTVMLVATYFGEQEIAWTSDSEKTTGLIISILIIQLVAVAGAVLTARSSEKYGNIPVLIVINAIWLAVCIVAFFIVSPIQFYVTAGVVGLIMGGIQSLSRSTYSKFLPDTRDTTSYFSFYDVVEKIGIVVGMSLYGIIDHITGTMRNSVLFLVLFFFLGIILLLRVPYKKPKN